jgi:hypothetical protein
LDVVFDPQLVAQPRDHRLPKDPIGARKGLHIGEQEPFEFDERLLEKDDIIQISRVYARSPQAEMNRLLRKLVVVFLPCEALLLGSRDELAVAEKGCRSIVEISGDAQDIHQNCLLDCSIGAPAFFSMLFQPRGVVALMASGSLRQLIAMETGPRITK